MFQMTLDSLHSMLVWETLSREFCFVYTETPKVAFAASLGGNGLQKTTTTNTDLIYRDVLTNVGGAYNAATGEIKWQNTTIYYHKHLLVVQ